MSAFLHSLLSAGITAGWIVAVVLVLRLLFKQAPRWISVALWALVAVRLLIPISWESPVSIVPSTRVEQAVEAVVPSAPPPTAESGASDTPSVMSTPVPDTPNTSAKPTAASAWSLTAILTAAWGVGVLAMLLYAVISTVILRHRVRDAVKQARGVYQSDRIASPFVLGVFRPRIYLPRGLDTEERLFVTAHEEAHIKRGDHLWKPLGFLLLSVYWFQPLLWVAYWCLCRDIEAACDERVVKTLSADERKQYSYTLVSLGHERRRIVACPVAFGEVGLKERVKRVMSYKKPAVWLIAAAVLLTTVASVCLLTNRETAEPSRAHFEGATLSVESEPHQDLKHTTMDVEEGGYVMLEDDTDDLLQFRINKVDTEDMTVTVGFSKPLWVDGVKKEDVTIPYDAEAIAVRSDDGTYIYTLTLSCPSSVRYESSGNAVYPGVWEDGRFSNTVYEQGELTLTLHPTFFEMHFGRLSDHTMYGVYREQEDRLILTEDSGVTEYVFIKEQNGSLRYDASASYRHAKSRALALDDGMMLEHRYTLDMQMHDNSTLVKVLDASGRAALEDDSFYGRPQYERLSDSLLRISGYGAGYDYNVTRQVYVNLDTMTALDTYDQVVSDRDSGATASIVNEGGMYYVRVVQYDTSDFCGVGNDFAPLTDTKFRLYSVEDIATAGVRVWLEEYRITIAYTGKDGKRTVTVYNWHTGDRVESTVHAVGGSVTLNQAARIETVFTEGNRRLHYSGITRAFYHLGDGQYVDLLTALRDGTLTLDALVGQIRADIESGALTDMQYYRDGGTRHGTYDVNDLSQSVTLKPQGNGSCDIYIGDPYVAVDHHATDPLVFSPN